MPIRSVYFDRHTQRRLGQRILASSGFRVRRASSPPPPPPFLLQLSLTIPVVFSSQILAGPYLQCLASLDSIFDLAVRFSSSLGAPDCSCANIIQYRMRPLHAAPCLPLRIYWPLHPVPFIGTDTCLIVSLVYRVRSTFLRPLLMLPASMFDLRPQHCTCAPPLMMRLSPRLSSRLSPRLSPHLSLRLFLYRPPLAAFFCRSLCRILWTPFPYPPTVSARGLWISDLNLNFCTLICLSLSLY